LYAYFIHSSKKTSSFPDEIVGTINTVDFTKCVVPYLSYRFIQSINILDHSTVDGEEQNATLSEPWTQVEPQSLDWPTETQPRAEEQAPGSLSYVK
jgi:hypothetical protein